MAIGRIILTWVILGYTLICFNAHSCAGELPDHVLTPGVSRNVTLNELCTTSTKLVRNVPDAEKKKVYAEYGMKGNDRSACKEGEEVDHLISLELGGSNDIKNLWPQSYCGTMNAKIKDKLENKLHALVCSNHMTIQDAQSCISTNWITCYQKVFK